MGKKSKCKRERLLRAKLRALKKVNKNPFSNLGSLLNNYIPMTEESENFEIKHLLEKRLESSNCSIPDSIPKCIDLSKEDMLCEKEVIDLTETNSIGVQCDGTEPMVIEISEEESNPNSESEEVCVIGTYKNFPKPSEGTTMNQELTDMVLCKEKTVKNLLMLRRMCKLNKNSKKHLKKRVKGENLRLGLPLHVRRKENMNKIGSNVYVNSPLSLPSSGLRPIIIDGNNVAYIHSNYHFCCKRLEICINYFKEKGHRVIAFVPQYRMSFKKNDDPMLLKKLEREGYVILTPSKEIDGRKVVPYDDRFIVQTAVIKGGIIISRDNFKDLLSENPAWADTIKYRTLAFTWVDDVLMFPEDPLGEFGPKLEEFLRFH